MSTRDFYFRTFTIVLAVSMIAAIYTLQNENFFYDESGIAQVHPYVIFVLGKTLRLVLNDLACFFIIWALFIERKYLQLAWYVFLIELLVVLPFYFAVKLTLEGPSEISSPLLSQVHRLIVNPALMFLLIIGFGYQKIKSRRHTTP